MSTHISRSPQLRLGLFVEGGLVESLSAHALLIALLCFWLGSPLAELSSRWLLSSPTLVSLLGISALVGLLTSALALYKALNLKACGAWGEWGASRALRRWRIITLTSLCSAALLGGMWRELSLTRAREGALSAWRARGLITGATSPLSAEVMWARQRGERVEVALELQPPHHLHPQAPPLGALLSLSALPEGVARGAEVWLTPPHPTRASLAELTPPPDALSFDYPAHLALQGLSVKAHGTLWLKREGAGMWRALQRARARLTQALKERGEAGALTLALALGDSSLLPEPLLERVRRLGLAHLLAVSGLHVGVVALLLGSLARLLSALIGALHPYRWGALVMCVSAWSVALLAQSPLSAQRAALGLTLYALSVALKRALKPLTLLTLVGWLLTLNTPALAQSLGFQLSWAAVFALCVTLPYTRSTAMGALMSAVSVSVAASLATAAPLAWHFGTLSPLSPLTNLLITPLASLTLLPLTLLGVMMSVPLSALGCAQLTSLSLDVSVWASGALLAVMKALPEWMSLTWAVGRVSALPLLGLFGLWASLTLTQRQGLMLSGRSLAQYEHIFTLKEALISHQRGHTSALIISLLSLLMIALIKRQPPPQPSLTALSVGQGDASLLLNGAGEAALFDAGPRWGGRAVREALLKRGVRRLEWVALSHLHPDHYEGLLTLLDHHEGGALEVGQVIYHGRALPSALSSSRSSRSRERSDERGGHPWREVLARLKQLNVPLVEARAWRWRWGGLELEWALTSPPKQLKENDASLGLIVRPLNSGARPQLALLSGDLERKGEARLSAWWAQEGRGRLLLWQADHHGSRTSSHVETLQALKPRLSTISLGAHNRYAFPHPATLNRLEGAGVRWARTDLEGHLTLTWPTEQGGEGAEQVGAQLEGEGRGLPLW